jgi:hypothetical protein
MWPVPTQNLDQEPLVPRLLGLLFMRLEDVQPAALGLGIQPGHGLAQGQGLVLVETEALGDHGCPQGQDRGTVDGNGSRSHTSVAPAPLADLSPGLTPCIAYGSVAGTRAGMSDGVTMPRGVSLARPLAVTITAWSAMSERNDWSN